MNSNNDLPVPLFPALQDDGVVKKLNQAIASRHDWDYKSWEILRDILSGLTSSDLLSIANQISGGDGKETLEYWYSVDRARNLYNDAVFALIAGRDVDLDALETEVDEMMDGGDR